VKEYCRIIFDTLRKYDYDPDLMKLYVVGGGSVLIKNFGTYNSNRVILITDVCATAKGYEFLAWQALNKG
jgi:plasmid segregation protein ParM